MPARTTRRSTRLKARCCETRLAFQQRGYIFVTMLRKLLKEQEPAYIAASFDLPGRTFRDDLAADYKAHRAPMPDDLASQIPLVHRACEALGVPIITYERYEADDVIGTLAMRGAAEGYGIVIVTGDKDFFQLVSNDIRVFNPRDDGTWYDAAGVTEKFGARPDQVVDVLALMGDAIDNVKGVPGIGEKGARELISTWGTLDALLEHAAEVPGKKYREALMNHQAEARASRELLVIHTNVPVPFEVDAFRYRGPSREDCYQLFSDLGFRSLTMEYAPTADSIEKDYSLVTDADGLEQLVAEIRDARRFSLRVLADQPGAMRAGIISLSVSTRARTAATSRCGTRDAHRSAVTVSRRWRLSSRCSRTNRSENRARLKFEPWSWRRHRAAGARARHDAGQLPARCHSLRAPARRYGARHLGYKALTEEISADAARRPPPSRICLPTAPDLRRRAIGPRPAAR